MTPVLKTFYQEQVLPELKKSQGYKNVHQVPCIEKIVINSGFDASIDRGGVEETTREISRIAGQQAVVTKARKSISNFKLREGMPVGVKVTLRGANMYDFLYRLLAVALPGIRDFRGINDKLDGQGNYTLGISDHTIFAEASQEHKRTIGMDICIVTSANTDAEGLELLKLMGLPFRKKNS
ncbi:MAG: 50S ribosomal protein L5 [Opitutales bacterium]|nr:50S ribosomal protein L5 [Opitutales bacterium]